MSRPLVQPDGIAALPAEARACRAIASKFSAAAPTYDAHAGLQQTVAEQLAGWMPQDDSIADVLDVGCGTGILTRILAWRYPHAQIDALDIAPRMIEHARSNTGWAQNIRWLVGDILNLDEHSRYDLVASSSALHWVRPLDTGLARIAAALRPGGKLICAMMLDGTLRELAEVRKLAAPSKLPMPPLPVAETVTRAATAAGFVIVRQISETIEVIYPSARALILRLHEQGLTSRPANSQAALLTRGELGKLESLYDSRFRRDNGVVATYRVMYLEVRIGERR